jgi:hypothetical protein
VLQGWAGWRRGWSVTLLRISLSLMIPTEVGHGFRFEAGHCSGMKPAIIPE